LGLRELCAGDIAATPSGVCIASGRGNFRSER
jgi:hypothetical protein